MDAILAHAKAWDLVRWKCPRHSTTLRSASYFQQKVNTLKTPEMCLGLDSDISAGCFTIIFAGSVYHFMLVSCWIHFCENVAGIQRPFNQLPSCVGKVNTLKTPEMRLHFHSLRRFRQMSHNYFLLDLFLILSFLPKLAVKWDESSRPKFGQ